ncbi:MAG: hypothetical protein K0R62_2716 [Nonomuraea muscovyensis]|nr:hypothetical protein [Nonomuraea muscovyensis]
MARTGPQRIPGASTAYFYGAGQYSGSDMEVNCGVVHTTEGRVLPSYSGGANAPTVTGVPDIAAKKIRWYQHYDVDESARALANKLGGVQTNTANAFQIELVGTCDDTKKTSWDGKKAGVDYLHWPTAPDWALAEVAWLVRWLNDYHAIPLTCVKDWLAYGKDARRPGITPASYGASPARMSFAQWQAFKGWCGHQHVPENDHGDPGSMNFARVIQLAKGETEPPVPQEDDMPTAQEIADAVWAKQFASPTAPQGTDPNRSAGTFLRWADVRHQQEMTQLAALSASVEALARLVGQDVDTEQVVAAVQQAIADAVIQVSVDVNTPKES